MEIKAIVREMLDAGMPESEILANLNELGVADPQKVLSEAKAASSKPRAASASLEKAGRDGLKTIPARRIGAEQHLAFLTSVRAYEAYVRYWNAKLAELE